MRSLLLLASIVAFDAATGRPLGNRLAELVHQDPLNEEKIDKMLSLIARSLHPVEVEEVVVAQHTLLFTMFSNVGRSDQRSFAFHGSNSGRER